MADRSRFEQIYRQQTQAGEGTFSALGSAARERARERADLRRLFPKTGMIGAMLEASLGKAYKAGAKSGKAGSMSGGASAIDDKSLNVIRVNTAIMAKNSMVLPGMARDMNVMRQNITRLTKHTTGSAATRADAHFLKAKERESSYESSIGKGSADKKSSIGKVAGGAGNIFKSIFGGLGSILGGTLALGGWAVSSLVSGLGSVLGIAGGLAGGILGVVGSAVSGLGIMGIIALAGAGYMISRMNKSGMFDDMSLGSMFGLSPRADGKGIFEDTSKKLDAFFKTDKFTETLHEIKGTLAGLAAASLKVFSNMSDMMSNYLNLALQELKILFVQFSEKALAIVGGYYGAKAGLGVGGAIGMLAGGPAGAAIAIGGTLAGTALGAWGGKSLAENINESLSSGDVTGRQKSLLQEINKSEDSRNFFETYVKLRRLQEAGFGDRPVDVDVFNPLAPGVGHYKNVGEALKQLEENRAKNLKERHKFDYKTKKLGGLDVLDIPSLQNLEKQFNVAYGAPLTTDETYGMLSMKFKRKHLEGLIQNQRSITEGVSDAFNETKDLYTKPTKAKNVNVMPSKASSSDMANLIRNRFIAAGFTPEQAEAAVVNAFAESTLNPNAHVTTAKEDSVGLFMANRKGGLGEGYSVEQLQDPNFNIELAIKQAKKSQAFGKAGTTSEAIAAFVRDVERPANIEEQISNRIAMANQPLEDAVSENTDAVNNLNKTLDDEKQSSMSEMLTALLGAMASTSTGATINNINNSSVIGGAIASPYNEDMLALFKNRATVGQ